MGYRIEYDGQAGKYEVYAETNWVPVLLMCAVLAIVGVLCFCPQWGEKLYSILIPGDDAVTLQAFQNITDDLRSGATVGEAVEAFCRFVIHGK